jgi:hypothetical protein
VDTWFQEEFHSAAGSVGSDIVDDDGGKEAEEFGTKRDSAPFYASLDVVNTWTSKYCNVKEAVDNLAAWAPSVMEYKPKKPADDPLS